MVATWTLEILFALVTVQLLVLFYIAYRRRSESPTEERAYSAESDGEGSRVECGECGAENDPVYQYCRECTADLEGESIPGYRYHSPSERSL